MWGWIPGSLSFSAKKSIVAWVWHSLVPRLPDLFNWLHYMYMYMYFHLQQWLRIWLTTKTNHSSMLILLINTQESMWLTVLFFKWHVPYKNHYHYLNNRKHNHNECTKVQNARQVEALSFDLYSMVWNCMMQVIQIRLVLYHYTTIKLLVQKGIIFI